MCWSLVLGITGLGEPLDPVLPQGGAGVSLLFCAHLLGFHWPFLLERLLPCPSPSEPPTPL